MAKKDNRPSDRILIPPTAAASLPSLRASFKGNQVQSKYLMRKYLSYAASGVLSPFRALERLQFDGKVADLKMDKAPLFVLGHWRSGTTFLHNLLCQDPQMAYVTTYQGTFAELSLHPLNRALFKTTMQAVMPKRRAGDNVILNADLPQEEEFALGNMGLGSFYDYWYFPTNIQTYYKRFVNFSSVDGEEQEARWMAVYDRLVRKAILNTGGQRFISKNPPNTGRVKTILKLYPNARFIHIYRNPVMVFLSTRNFYKSMLPYLCFEDIADERLEAHIFSIYEQMMQQYETDKLLIPSENLVELRFEHLQKAPLDHIQTAYEQLRIDGFENARPKFEAFVAQKKSYKKNTYKVAKYDIDRVLTHWNFAMERYGYSVPDHIEVV